MTNIEQELEKKEAEKPKFTKAQLQDQLDEKETLIETLQKKLKDAEIKSLSPVAKRTDDPINIQRWKQQFDMNWILLMLRKIMTLTRNFQDNMQKPFGRRTWPI